MRALILACLLALGSARPSFIAVPADQIAFIDLSQHVRVPRQTLTPPPQPPQQNLYDEDYQPIPVQDYQPIPVEQYQAIPPQEYQAIATPEFQPIPALKEFPYRPQNLLAPPPPPQPQQARVVTLQQQQPDVQQAATLGGSARLAERPPDFGEYVDFGAHTGDNGAFGWYADYPINNHDDSSGFRK